LENTTLRGLAARIHAVGEPLASSAEAQFVNTFSLE
jgi:hypothetical protein